MKKNPKIQKKINFFFALKSFLNHFKTILRLKKKFPIFFPFFQGSYMFNDLGKILKKMSFLRFSIQIPYREWGNRGSQSQNEIFSKN